MYLFAPFIIAFGISLVVTPLIRALAWKSGQVARPTVGRWHKKPTAMLGGAAIVCSFYIGALIFVKTLWPVWVVFLVALIPFFIGLVDDIRDIHPQTKLLGIIVAGSILLILGYQLTFTPYSPLNLFITMFWIVGITNAINLLDNMDGLAAGISFIATVFLVYFFAVNGKWGMVTATALFSGGLLGFLVFNFHPASIFMGDAGSLFIGFLLSALPMATGFQPTSSLFSVLVVPALILLIPIFDTTFVTIMRTLARRAVSQGGRDHTSHRLVAIGLTEREAVLTLYGLALLSGGLALLMKAMDIRITIAVIPLFFFVLVFFGAYLGRAKPYSPYSIDRRKGPVIPILVDIAYKRRMLEVVMDFVLVALSYYMSYLIRFEGTLVPGNVKLLLESLPVVILCKMTAFFGFRMYRGVWRYTGLDDLVTYFKATTTGSILSILSVLFIFHLSGYSRTVFIIDWLLLFMMISGSRFSFQLLDRIVRRRRAGRHVLIYGAGDGGSFALLEMLNNESLRMMPVGFIDDDDAKKGKKIHGYPVYGDGDRLKEIIEKKNVSEVVISSPKINGSRLARVQRICDDHDVSIRTLSIRWGEIHRPRHKEYDRT